MKSIKKFLALALALALCFAMAVPAMADEEESYDGAVITIAAATDGPTLTGHTYDVYQIFTGDLATVNGSKVLSNIKYGTNYGTTGDLVPSSLLKVLEDQANAEAFANFLMGTGTDETNAAFANFPTFVAASTPFKTLNGENEYSVGSKEDPIPNGYYLIVDRGTAAETDDAISAYIVEAIGVTAVNPKLTVPQLDKKVKVDGMDDSKDNDGYTNDDAVNAEIGKTIEFELEATVPVANLAQYKYYTMEFSDTMSAGLTFKGVDEVYVNGVELTDKIEKLNPAFNEDEDADNSGYYAQTGYYVSSTVDSNAKETNITVEIPNVLNSVEIDDIEGTELVVKVVYKATLNKDAVVTSAGGTGENITNWNKAKLTYSNDPYKGGKGGNTPEDKTYIYSFELDVTKEAAGEVDDEGNTIVLAGAIFELYKGTEIAEDATPIEFVDLGSGKYVVYSSENYEDPQPETTSSITTITGGKLYVDGLAEGDYVLKETTAPDGYNLCDPIHIQIKSEEIDVENPDEGENGGPKLILQMKKTTITGDSKGANTDVNEDDDEFANGTGITVLNSKGTLLPSTGGIGTTIFYAIGGALVVGAGVLLFVRKRMGSRG